MSSFGESARLALDDLGYTMTADTAISMRSGLISWILNLVIYREESFRLRFLQSESRTVRFDLLVPHSTPHVGVKGNRHQLEDDFIFLQVGVEVDLSRAVNLEGFQGRLPLGQLVEDDARVRNGRHVVRMEAKEFDCRRMVR